MPSPRHMPGCGDHDTRGRRSQAAFRNRWRRTAGRSRSATMPAPPARPSPETSRWLRRRACLPVARTVSTRPDLINPPRTSRSSSRRLGDAGGGGENRHRGTALGRDRVELAGQLGGHIARAPPALVGLHVEQLRVGLAAARLRVLAGFQDEEMRRPSPASRRRPFRAAPRSASARPPRARRRARSSGPSPSVRRGTPRRRGRCRPGPAPMRRHAISIALDAGDLFAHERAR